MLKMKVPFENCVFKAYPQGSVTQFFGENPKLYASMGLAGHNGIDLVAPHGTPMVAIESGIVVEVNNNPKGYGKHLRIVSKKSKKGLCNEWTYGHCDTISVTIGQEVEEGQVVATMGNTGFVVSGQTAFWKFNPFAGTHLHLGLRKIKKDPKGWSYVGSKVKISVPNYGNGYKGAIDPLTEFNVVKDVNVANLEAQVSLLSKVVELYKQLRKVK